MDSAILHGLDEGGQGSALDIGATERVQTQIAVGQLAGSSRACRRTRGTGKLPAPAVAILLAAMREARVGVRHRRGSGLHSG